MNIIKINNNEYYNTEDLLKIKPDYFKLCCGKLRSIITWKKISDEYYIYAYEKDNKWILSNVKYVRSKLLLLKKFCEDNIMQYKLLSSQNVKKEPIKNSNIIYEDLPPLLELNDNEQIYDDNNKLLEIEIRGERKYNKIYFKGIDVEREFLIPQLIKQIMNKDTNYEYNIHYKFYCGKELTTVENKHNSLYLTYFGLIRLIFNSKGNKIAEKIQEWALIKLFTHQFGTIEQKKQLASELITGIPYNDMKRFLNIHINEIPCVYLICLGDVKTLRNGMNIELKYNDDNIIFKFGFSKNFKERYINHKTTFGKIPNINLSLKYISIIDAEHVSNAERDIKNNLYKFIL